MKAGLAWAITVAAIAAGPLARSTETTDEGEPGSGPPPDHQRGGRLSVGAARKIRVRAIHERTGWAFARCHEVADLSDEEIDVMMKSEIERR